MSLHALLSLSSLIQKKKQKKYLLIVILPLLSLCCFPKPRCGIYPSLFPGTVLLNLGLAAACKQDRAAESAESRSAGSSILRLTTTAIHKQLRLCSATQRREEGKKPAEAVIRRADSNLQHVRNAQICTNLNDIEATVWMLPLFVEVYIGKLNGTVLRGSPQGSRACFISGEWDSASMKFLFYVLRTNHPKRLLK